MAFPGRCGWAFAAIKRVAVLWHAFLLLRALQHRLLLCMKGAQAAALRILLDVQLRLVQAVCSTNQPRLDPRLLCFIW